MPCVRHRMLLPAVLGLPAAIFKEVWAWVPLIYLPRCDLLLAPVFTIAGALGAGESFPIGGVRIGCLCGRLSAPEHQDNADSGCYMSFSYVFFLSPGIKL